MRLLSTETPWEYVSDPIEVDFPAANSVRDVAHGLGVVPDGRLIVKADANVFDEPGQMPNDQLWYLRSQSANSRATVVFYVGRKGNESVT